MQTILFYGRDGAKAKERAKELRKASKGKVLICDVTVWEGTKDGDSAEIMDCVSYFDRQRIEHVFGGLRGIAFDPTTDGPPIERFEISDILDSGEEDLKPAPKKRGRPRKNAEAV